MDKIYISKKTLIKWVGIVLVILVGSIWWMRNEKAKNTVWEETSGESVLEMDSMMEREETEPDSDSKMEEEKEILVGVHVTGAVINPDQVYLLQEGSRVADAIAAAGGAKKDADLSQLNLAGYIHDGQQIYVPMVGEKIENIANTGGENQEKLLTNINLATKIELLNLPGIGEAYAERIIQHREENGPFEKIEDIMEVKGIGESKFNDMKDKITVD